MGEYVKHCAADRQHDYPSGRAKEHGQRGDRCQQHSTMRDCPSLPHLPGSRRLSIGAGDMRAPAIAGAGSGLTSLYYLLAQHAETLVRHRTAVLDVPR